MGLKERLARGAGSVQQGNPELDTELSIYQLSGCPRCRGFMVSETCLDLDDGYEVWCQVLRCIHCGEILDPMILQNRWFH